MMLLLRYWQAGVIAILAGVLMLACNQRDHAIANKARAEVRAHAADSALAVSKVEITRLSAAIVHDTTEVTRLIAKHDTLVYTQMHYDTVYAPTDTTHSHPLVAIPIAEAATDDSVRHACSLLSNDCAAFRRMAQQRFDEYETKLRAVGPIQGSCTWRERATWSILGGVGGMVVEHRLSR